MQLLLMALWVYMALCSIHTVHTVNIRPLAAFLGFTNSNAID